tara:strand:+ start:142 stop:1260 length:1119 start_codon:yes stop_codon:yes gene_type:complete
MKPFKHFFEDDETGDIDIFAKEPRKRAEPLGQVTSAGKQDIERYIDNLHQGGNELIETLVADSNFITKTGRQETNDYLRSFRSVMADAKYRINWTNFANHVNNRFDNYNIQDDINGRHGSWNMLEKYLPRIEQFVESNAEGWFEEVFTISHKIAGTSVGDGEFLLGIIGNAQKGSDKGDIDVVEGQPGGTMIAGRTVLEVGTAGKIIGASSREAGRKNYGRIIRDLVIGDIKKVQYIEDDTWVKIDDKLHFYNATKAANNLNLVRELIYEYSSENPDPKQLEKQNSKLTRVIGGLVLYDYIIGHKDDVIMSINYGTSRYKRSDKEGSIDLYETRYAYPKKMGLRRTIELMINKNFYNFMLDGDATRFRLGTN